MRSELRSLLGKYIFEIKFSKPLFSLLLSALGMKYLKVVPKEEVEKIRPVLLKFSYRNRPI